MTKLSNKSTKPVAVTTATQKIKVKMERKNEVSETTTRNNNQNKNKYCYECSIGEACHFLLAEDELKQVANKCISQLQGMDDAPPKAEWNCKVHYVVYQKYIHIYHGSLKKR
jgi:hypothetical protein